jgi:hypothetical protein
MGAIEARRSVSTPRSKRSARSKSRDPATDVDAWLEAISPANTQTARREHAFHRLMLQARRDPQPLLDRWDDLAHLLRTRKAFSLYPTVHILAALVPADSMGRFERIFSAYFALLDDEAISVAAHVAQLAGGIALARPKLQRRIIRRLLATDQSHFDAERRGLLGSYALQSLEAIYGHLPTPRPVLEFARRLLESPSPRARKAAKSFLHTHDRA